MLTGWLVVLVSSELLLTPVGPSSWTVLTDSLRVLLVSVLCDLTQVGC